MIGTSIATLLVACVVSVVLCVFLYFRCVDLECKVDVVQESKEALRESLTKHNYSLFQEKEKLAKEVTAKTLVKELSIMEASEIASDGRIQDVTDARVLDIVDIIKAA